MRPRVKDKELDILIFLELLTGNLDHRRLSRAPVAFESDRTAAVLLEDRNERFGDFSMGSVEGVFCRGLVANEEGPAVRGAILLAQNGALPLV